MSNFKRAKAAALQVPEIKAELERYLTLKRRIYDGDIITLSKEVCDAITPIYVGKEPRLVMEWAAWDRIAAKNDAKALVKAIATQHRKSYPHLYQR